MLPYVDMARRLGDEARSDATIEHCDPEGGRHGLRPRRRYAAALRTGWAPPVTPATRPRNLSAEARTTRRPGPGVSCGLSAGKPADRRRHGSA